MRADPAAMLFAFAGAVPLAAGGAGLAAFLLQRAGFGILVWGVLPALGMLAVVGVLGIVLGKAAFARRSDGRRREEDGV